MSNHRLERVEDNIRSSLSGLFLTEARDPRLRLASVTSVKVSRDLGVADVAVSFSDPEADRDECLEALTRAAGFFRHHLAQRLRLRHTPELRFRLDRGAEYSERIENLLIETGVSAPTDARADSPAVPPADSSAAGLRADEGEFE